MVTNNRQWFERSPLQPDQGMEGMHLEGLSKNTAWPVKSLNQCWTVTLKLSPDYL